MKVRIEYELLLSRTTETDSGSEPSAEAKWAVVWKAHVQNYAFRVIVEAMITVMATLSWRKRWRQVRYRPYSQCWCFDLVKRLELLWIGVWKYPLLLLLLLKINKETTNMLHHTGKQGAKIWLENQLPFFCKVPLIHVLVICRREVLVSEVGNLRRKHIVDLMCVHR